MRQRQDVKTRNGTLLTKERRIAYEKIWKHIVDYSSNTDYYFSDYFGQVKKALEDAFKFQGGPVLMAIL